MEKLMSLHSQTMRIRHRLEQWTGNKRKHWDLYRWLMDPFVLLDALKLVLRNDGSAGIDGESCRSIRGKEWEYVSQLSQSLRDRSYRPSAVRRVEIPKVSGGKRLLGIPVLRDRVVQRALVLLMEPIYEQRFLPCSYGFRPGRSAMQCAVESAEAMYRRRYVLEADIERFFDTVRHEKLVGMLRQEIVDPRILNLISSFLRSGSMQSGGEWEATKEGTPQGGPLSPLLANIYLHYALDERFEKTAQVGEHTKLLRYCDDFIVVTNLPGRLKSVRRALHVWMREAGLKLKESKTREVDMRNEKRGRESHLDFLGYRFHLRAFKDNPKRFWVARQPSEKGRLALRQNLREKLIPNLSLAEAKQMAHAIWNGWCGYYRYGNANRVLSREVHSVRKEIYKYLRRKYRHQRRPVPWRRLLPLGKELMRGLRPVSVISGHPQQGRTLSFA
jgi:RNA-directed DNA polymerase